MCTMKKAMRLHVRIDPEAKASFEEACTKARAVPADVIRDLMELAAAFMKAEGAWVPTQLVRKADRVDAAALRLALENAGPEGAALHGVLRQLVREELARCYGAKSPLLAAEEGGVYATGAGAAGVSRQPITPQVASTARTRVARQNAARTEAHK